MLRAFAGNNVHLEPVPTETIDEALVAVPPAPVRDDRTYRISPTTVADLIRVLSKLPQDARVMVAPDVDDTNPNDVTDIDLDELGERFVLENPLSQGQAKLLVVPDGDEPAAYFQDDDGTVVTKAVVIRRHLIGDCLHWRREK